VVVAPVRGRFLTGGCAVVSAGGFWPGGGMVVTVTVAGGPVTVSTPEGWDGGEPGGPTGVVVSCPIFGRPGLVEGSALGPTGVMVAVEAATASDRSRPRCVNRGAVKAIPATTAAATAVDDQALRLGSRPSRGSAG
jgi:hypothetical protein